MFSGKFLHKPVIASWLRRPLRTAAERAQAMVIISLAFVALVAFAGMVTDIGALYVTYTELKRAVDSAAVAAANNIKYPHASEAERKLRITEAAREILYMDGVKMESLASLEVYLCSDLVKPAAFDSMCPDIAAGDPPRKLAWIQVTQNSPIYFLAILGIQSVPFTVTSVGEAATVDLVLVFDTSESMANDNDCSDAKCTPGYTDPTDFDPATCNANNTCYPLREAKDAAKSLINNLFRGYDRVAIVTYDYQARTILSLTTEIGDDDGAFDGDAFDFIDHEVHLHDDAPAGRLVWYKYKGTGTYPQDNPLNAGKFNPIFPDDRDGDGLDFDGGSFICTDQYKWDDASGAFLPGPDLIDDTSEGYPSGLAPVENWTPCDNDYILDAYDWNRDGDFSNDNRSDKNPAVMNTYEVTSILSTCTGCGLREATRNLAEGGRPNGIWVMVMLTDGVVNLSDMPIDGSGDIPTVFTYGFCGNNPGTSFWYFPERCKDMEGQTACSGCSVHYGVVGRFCVDANSAECPSEATHTNATRPYSVDDYARDMADEAALLESDNAQEPMGENIIVYTIALGREAVNGEDLLRYVANVGEDGTRFNDLCETTPPEHSCGNYYYAPNASYLAQIFESIASRIFTKISK